MLQNKNVSIQTSKYRKKLVGKLSTNVLYLKEELVIDCSNLYSLSNTVIDLKDIINNRVISNDVFIFIKNLDIDTLQSIHTYLNDYICFIELSIHDIDVERLSFLNKKHVLLLKNISYSDVSNINKYNSLIPNDIICYIDSTFMYNESLGNSLAQAGNYLLFHDDGLMYSLSAKYKNKICYFLHDSELNNYSDLIELVTI